MHDMMVHRARYSTMYSYLKPSLLSIRYAQPANVSCQDNLNQSKFRKGDSDSLGIAMAYAYFHALDASFISGSFGVTVQLYIR